MEVVLNSAKMTTGNAVGAQEASTVANATAAAASGKTVAAVLGTPSLTVTETDLVDAYFEPLKNTAKNLAPSEKQEELKKRRAEEQLEEEQEKERLQNELLQKELDESRAAQETPLV